MQRQIQHFLISARYHLESQRNKNNVAAPVDPTAPVDSINYSMIGSIKREYIENQPLSDTPFNHTPRTPSMIMPSVSQTTPENNPYRHHMNTEETMTYLPNTANRSEMASSLGFQTPSAASKFSLPDNNISPTSAFLAQLTSSPKHVTISITAASPEQLNAPENSLPTPRALTPTAQSNVSSLDGMPDVNTASNGPNVSQNVVNKFCAKKERIEVTEEPALDTRSDVFQGATETEYLDRPNGIEVPNRTIMKISLKHGCCSFGGRPPLITEVNTAQSLANSQTNSDVPRNLVAPNGNTYESERDLNLESRHCQGRPHIKIPLILNEFHFDDRWKKRKIPSTLRSAYAVFTFLNRKGLNKEREFLKEQDPAQWGSMNFNSYGVKKWNELPEEERNRYDSLLRLGYP
ncbi:hypothetical protein Ddc_17085 [Ditylenchus destructor]|nr:hypothetical protein Ddc_17085 [Ditylenchus destructor]